LHVFKGRIGYLELPMVLPPICFVDSFLFHGFSPSPSTTPFPPLPLPSLYPQYPHLLTTSNCLRTPIPLLQPLTRLNIRLRSLIIERINAGRCLTYSCLTTAEEVAALSADGDVVSCCVGAGFCHGAGGEEEEGDGGEGWDLHFGRLVL
jgi:hypothetical protein